MKMSFIECAFQLPKYFHRIYQKWKHEVYEFSYETATCLVNKEHIDQTNNTFSLTT